MDHTGLGLVEQILEKHHDAFVYAGVRDPSQSSALEDIEKKYCDRIVIVKCVSAYVEGNATLAKEIEERHGRVDTVVANASMSST